MYTDDGGQFDFFEIRLIKGEAVVRLNLGKTRAWVCERKRKSRRERERERERKRERERVT